MLRASRGAASTVALVAMVVMLAPARPVAAAPTSGPPAAESRVLLRFADEKYVDAKLVEARDDSILVRKGKRSQAFPTESIEGVWTWRRDPVGGLKAGAIYGGLIGLAHGFAVPVNCVDCDDARGSAGAVASSMIVFTGGYALVGLVSGYFDGAWQNGPGFPGTSTATRGSPFPMWGLSFSAGVTKDIDSAISSPSGAIAGYRNTHPRSALGFETGILKTAELYTWSYPWYNYAAPADTTWPPQPRQQLGTIQFREESAWTYAALFVARMREAKGGVRSHFLIGPALYGQRIAFSGEYRDSTGALVRSHEGGDVDSHLGLMTGVGITFGGPTFRPALRARGHWILSDQETFALTFEAGLDFN